MQSINMEYDETADGQHNEKTPIQLASNELNRQQTTNEFTDNWNLWQVCRFLHLFSLKLLINVVSHDAVVRVVLDRVVALIKYDQREKTQWHDVAVDQRVQHDLWCHDNHVVLRRELAQRQFRVLLATLGKNPQCAQVALEHTLLLCHQPNSRHKEDYFGISITLLSAFKMMLAE